MNCSGYQLFGREEEGVFDDRFANMSEIIEENGFIFEEHNVMTEDGYILTMHRIPPS